MGAFWTLFKHLKKVYLKKCSDQRWHSHNFRKKTFSLIFDPTFLSSMYVSNNFECAKNFRTNMCELFMRTKFFLREIVRNAPIITNIRSKFGKKSFCVKIVRMLPLVRTKGAHPNVSVLPVKASNYAYTSEGFV